jgi:hypothetical protein
MGTAAAAAARFTLFRSTTYRIGGSSGLSARTDSSTLRATLFR